VDGGILRVRELDTGNQIYEIFSNTSNIIVWYRKMIGTTQLLISTNFLYNCFISIEITNSERGKRKKKKKNSSTYLFGPRYRDD
jgi:hypothetical protein